MELSGSNIKFFLYFKKCPPPPKKILILFYTLNKTPLAEIGCLSSLYYLLPAQASSCLIHSPLLNTVIPYPTGTLPLTVHYVCDLWDVIGHSLLPVQPFLGR